MDRPYQGRTIQGGTKHSCNRCIQPEETIGSNFFYRIINDGYVEGVGMNRCFHIALFQGNDNAMKRYFADPLCPFPKKDYDRITDIASNPDHRRSVRDYVEKNNVCVEIYANYGGKVSLVERFSSGHCMKDDKKKKIFIFSFGEHFEQMVASNHPNASKYTLPLIIRTSAPEAKLSPRAIEEINKDINRAVDAQNPDIQRAIEISMKHTVPVQIHDRHMEQALAESKKIADIRASTQSQIQRALVESRKFHAEDLQIQQAQVESRKFHAEAEERKRRQKLIDDKKQQIIANDAQYARSLAETFKKDYEQYLRDEVYAQRLASQYMMDNDRIVADAQYARNLFIN